MALRTLHMSYQEFLDSWDESCGAEWKDCTIVPMTPANRSHQDLAGMLEALLRIYAEARRLGKVLPAPFQMKTGPDLPGREPDVLFVATAHLDRLQEKYLDGPADLAVEIVSPDSRLRDRGEKLAEYEMGGVREYWVIDPELKRADFHLLGEDGRYRLREPVDGVYPCEVLPGLELPLAWLWEHPLPDILHCVRGLGLL